jgi:hypothetical protein
MHRKLLGFQGGVINHGGEPLYPELAKLLVVGKIERSGM